MNPRNPYDYEVSFDQHVWLPAAAQTYRSIVDLIDDRGAIDRLINRHLKPAVGRDPEPLATEKILLRLSEDELTEVRRALEARGEHAYSQNMLVFASFHYPDLRSRLGTSVKNPPDHIHRMQKSDYYIGDIYSADLVATTLSRCNLGLEPDCVYLDFGCSSGSLIRVLQAAAPEASFHGVDPVRSSIEWASQNIERATFAVSNISPPLAYESGQFRGVTAISIWSHLGQVEALAWFNEMHRVIQPGGWLLFTAHGESSICHYNAIELFAPRRILALLEGIVNSDFVFEEVYLGKSPEGLSAAGYGNVYFRRAWIERWLGDKWEIVYFGEAENQRNQDVYVLRKRPPEVGTFQAARLTNSYMSRVLSRLSWIVASIEPIWGKRTAQGLPKIV
ncbi:class I SAM-dependent methyltransferase [Ensifer sp. YR511]|uniref:class I SAM-dependent methyltransferase n=1 Tax=Ensifer sp. YR511 TaxID=1855294 RepID=UPI000889C4A0|nr:class I SAM-dependent methyltransferase [Ensifer sp. YR511]SDM56966.1 Methyltransferase domain-containing protein [Ensifer sp. YR511]